VIICDEEGVAILVPPLVVPWKYIVPPSPPVAFKVVLTHAVPPPLTTTGVVPCTSIAIVLAALVPHALVAVTLKSPKVAEVEKLTNTLFVVPPVIVAPVPL
jgi:hypothetical protein